MYKHDYFNFKRCFESYLRQAYVLFIVNSECGDFVAMDFDESALVVLRGGLNWRRGRVDGTIHCHSVLEVLGESLLNML